MAFSRTNLIFFVVLIGGILIGDVAEAESIKVVSVVQEPYLTINSKGFYEGIIPDFLDSITASLGVNYTLNNVSKYGALDSKMKWSGMMGEIVNKEADIAGLLTATYTRAKDVKFSYPVTSVGPAIVLKRPPKERVRITENLNSLFKPFDFTVWLMTILAFVVTSTVLYMISHFNPYEWRRMFKDREATLREAESFTCMNSFWFALGALTWQGFVRAPRSVGGRLVVTGWWLFVLLLILSYVASLTNLLRMGPKPLEAQGYSKIRGFSDLAKTNNIKVLVVPSGSTEDYFKTSALPMEQIISKKITETQTHIDIANVAEGIKTIKDSPFSDIVMILESDTAKFTAQQPPCDLYMVSDHIVNAQQAFAFAPGSKWIDPFNMALLKMKDDGTWKNIANKWSPKGCENSVVYSQGGVSYEFQQFYKVDLGAFFGAVLILGIALILGGFATLIELCIFKWAETHVDEEEIKEEPDADVSNKLIDSTSSRGGATQV